MLAQPIHNKPTPRRGSAPSEKVIAPERGVACEHMNWSEYLIVDFDAGVLTWKTRISDFRISESQRKAWNTRRAGTVAGGVNAEGYMQVKLFNNPHYTHRIIWEMANGSIPEGAEIDHIDQNKANNSLSNLRLATCSENERNKGLQATNTSGVKGVHYDKSRCKWLARITCHGIHIHLGRFATLENAVDARRAAELKYYGEFAPTH